MASEKAKMDNVIINNEYGADIIDGKKSADLLDNSVRLAIGCVTDAIGRAPSLAVILVGANPASLIYVRNKVRRSTAVGIHSIEHRLTSDSFETDVIDLVNRLNDDTSIDGILVQLPLPDHIDDKRVVEAINPEKDVDGLTPCNAGKLVHGTQGMRPCTPSGCVWLAKAALGNLKGKSVTIIGRSILVGKPAGLLFLEQNCTVTMAHSRTENLIDVCSQSDILVSAVGRPEFINANYVKAGAVVLDVGINRVEHGKNQTRLVGDIHLESVSEKAGFVTPVPGGVGPMTISFLLVNTLLAACWRNKLDLPEDLVKLLV